MMMVAVPMMGQDYLTVVMKDGTKKQYLAKEGIKIYLSKTDKSGEQFNDYQSQCIEFGDHIAKYPLTSIDSVTFTKFNEVKAYENFTSTLNAVSEFSNRYSSVEDAKEHVSELESNPTVEYVNVSDDMITVKIKGMNKLYILDVPEEADEDASNSVRQLLRQKQTSQYSSEPIVKIKNLPYNRVVITNGRINEPKHGGKHQTEIFEPLAQKFRECGISAIASNGLSFDNATENLLDCDILIMYAHGGIDEGEHYFTTSTILASADNNPDLVAEEYRKIISEQKNNDKWATYVNVTIPGWKDAYIFPTIDEDMLNFCYPTTKKFNSNNSIVFIGACHSLDKTNSFADFFLKRGAACYMGYDGSTAYSHNKIEHVFSSMLNGISDIVAGKKKFIEPLANFHNIHRDDVKTPIFLFNTISRQISIEEAKSYYLKNGKVQLKGVTTMWDKQSPKVEFGFLYGKEKDNLNKKTKGTYDASLTDDEGNFVFTADIDLSEYADGYFHKDYYYYQAYTYDGEYYNLGEIQQIRLFDVLKNYITSLTITSPTTTMDLCEVKSIEYHFTPIDASNKTMEWTSSDPSIVTVDQNGIATAFKTGTCTITVKTTDGSNLSATCIITVTENGGPKTDQPEVSGTSATLYGHHTCIGDYLRGFAYWEEGHEDRKTFVNSLSTGIAFSAGVSDLKENTTYYCQAVCTHYEHNFYANIVKFTTGSASAPDSSHEYVDLGLSVKWATCNVGASKPEEYGDYFAWGETAPKNDYSGDTYFDVFSTEYNGYGDKYQLDSEDDAATVRLGANWRIPTCKEFSDLMNECTWTWTTKNGVNGYEVTGPSGKSIFMPAAGYRMGNELRDEGSCGNYWIDYVYVLPFANATGLASCVSFSSNNVRDSYNYAPSGLTIRPVYSEIPRDIEVLIIKVTGDTKEIAVGETIQLSAKVLPVNASVQEVRWQSSDESIASVSNTGVVTGKSAGKVTIYAVSTDGHNAKGRYELTITKTESTHEYVDLGLSVKWATCNIGANSPEEYGSFFSWGETEVKEDYGLNTYFDNASDDIREFKYYKYSFDSGKTVLDLEDDAAHVKWGGNWRMPSKADMEELINPDNCVWTWEVRNGVNGQKVTSKINGNSIFLPVVSNCVGNYSLDELAIGIGYYMSNTLESSTSMYILSFSKAGARLEDHARHYGWRIRPVCP